MKSENRNPGGKNYLCLCDKLCIKPADKIIAMWGYPDPEVLQHVLNSHPGYKVVDLDVDYGAPESKILPENYCQIITNIIDNALALKDNIEVIVASIGEEKCDQGRFAAYILERMGFNIIKTRFVEYDYTPAEPVISTSTLPLKQKVLLIMDSLIAPALIHQYEIIKAPAEKGFWGVPPNDLSILELFPNNTYVYGWTRCVEMKQPANLELEMFVDPRVPTVFFAQTFCAKMQLARFLARKHDGLYVDVDDLMNISVRAKIEAFLRLS
jgi:hypothetical protein